MVSASWTFAWIHQLWAICWSMECWLFILLICCVFDSKGSGCWCGWLGLWCWIPTRRWKEMEYDRSSCCCLNERVAGSGFRLISEAEEGQNLLEKAVKKCSRSYRQVWETVLLLLQQKCAGKEVQVMAVIAGQLNELALLQCREGMKLVICCCCRECARSRAEFAEKLML